MSGETDHVEHVYDNPWFGVRRSGRRHWIEERHGNRGAVLLPVRFDGRILMLSVERPAVARLSLELPRGAADPGEDAGEAAWRELREEAGLGPGHVSDMERLGMISPNTSILASTIPAFLIIVNYAEPEVDTKAREEEGIVDHRWMTPREIGQAMQEGVIHCGFTLSALALYEAWRKAP